MNEKDIPVNKDTEILKVSVLKTIIRGSGIVTGGVITMSRKKAAPLIKSGHLKEVK